jgi:hypothetical protein
MGREEGRGIYNERRGEIREETKWGQRVDK